MTRACERRASLTHNTHTYLVRLRTVPKEAYTSDDQDPSRLPPHGNKGPYLYATRVHPLILDGASSPRLSQSHIATRAYHLAVGVRTALGLVRRTALPGSKLSPLRNANGVEVARVGLAQAES